MWEVMGNFNFCFNNIFVFFICFYLDNVRILRKELKIFIGMVEVGYKRFKLVGRK